MAGNSNSGPQRPHRCPVCGWHKAVHGTARAWLRSFFDVGGA